MAKAKKAPEHAPGDVFYFEYYPHYTGEMTCSWWMKPVTFAMMRILYDEYQRVDKVFAAVVKRMRARFGEDVYLPDLVEMKKYRKDPLVQLYRNALANVNETLELFDDFCNDVRKENGQEQQSYAIGSLLECSPQRIASNLARKGVFATTWEEGSHVLSVVGETPALKALRKVEAEVAEECAYPF